ncbi:MAG: hypothetical protein M3P33_00265 [bacterium]|nr:hypothetical protein [bacterium]
MNGECFHPQYCHAFLKTVREMRGIDGVITNYASELQGITRKCILSECNENRLRWENVPRDTDCLAIIIPAFNEPGIGKLLAQINEQSKQLIGDGSNKIKKVKVIVCINNEISGGITDFATIKFSEDNPDRIIDLDVFISEQKGKLNAQSTSINRILYSNSIPNLIFFCDADSTIGDGCLGDMVSVLSEGITAVGAKAKYQTQPSIRATLALLPYSQHGEIGSTWMSGGMLGMDSSLLPLYKSYIGVLPGMLNEDSGWSALLTELNINYTTTENEYLSITAPPNWTSVISQQLRWMSGQRQLRVIGNSNEVCSNSITRRTIRRLAAALPEFPIIRGSHARHLLVETIAKEGPAIPFFASIKLITNYLKKRITVNLGKGKILTIGGEPPNPFVNGYWRTIR